MPMGREKDSVVLYKPCSPADVHSCIIICINIICRLVSSQEDLHVFVSCFSLSLAARVDERKEPKNRHLCEVHWSAFVDVYLYEYGVKDSVY